MSDTTTCGCGADHGGRKAVAVDGEVRVARGARVEGDAFSLGGKVRVSRGGLVAGDRGTLSATWGGASLAAALAGAIAERVSCEDLEEEADDEEEGEGEDL